ncbi:MAG: phosphotransferase family protein [Leptospira sp.]|nr:phosphotransferase family protein [Leptospira sp.]
MSEPIQSKLEGYLSNRLQGDVSISSLRSLSGGACQENYFCDVSVSSGEFKGSHHTVLRTDKGASLMASLSREDEYAVIDLAFSKGVKTPRPFWLETDHSVIGKPFYFMERISGNANGRFLVKDSSLNPIRNSLGLDLAKNLAIIHAIQPDQASKKVQDILWNNSFNENRSTNIASVAVDSLRNELKKRQEAYPAMELILNWLEENAVPTEEPVLVHGDFRTGNFMVTPEGLQGIVDWEFAHWGDFHEDLTWFCMRDWRFGKIKLEAGGLLDRKTFYEHYEKFSGRSVSPQKITYWEVMGNLRWAIGCLGQAERHLSGRDKGIELASIGRRACEMEWEAMRLIENAR